MNARCALSLGIAGLLGCAATPKPNTDTDKPAIAQVFLKTETSPSCPSVKLGRLTFRLETRATGGALVDAVRKEAGRRGSARSADAVVETSWEKMLTVVVAGSGNMTDYPGKYDVTGTLVRFASPTCTS